MNWVIILAIACGIAVAQGLFLGITLIIKNGKQINPDLFLGLALFGLAIRIGKSLVYYFSFDMSLWGVALGGAGLWLTGPSIFLFIVSLKMEKINPLHWMHFFPAFLLLFSGAVLDWSGMDVVYRLGVFQLLVYISISFYMVYQSALTNKRNLIAILTGILLIGGAFIYQILSDNITSYAIGGVIGAVVLYLLNFVVFKGIRKTGSKHLKPTNKIKQEMLQQVLEEIQEVFQQNGFYKEPKLTLNRLADKIERPPYLVRQAIVQSYGTNFNDFVNNYRINEVKRMIDEDCKNYTFEGMALDVGFSSTSSFYQAFKKKLNCTPLEYKKRIAIQR